MKNLKINSLLVGLLVAAAMGLTACGGGTGGGSDVNPGDGVATQAEVDTLKADMTQQQVAAILGNPTVNYYPSLKYPGEAVNGRPSIWVVTYGNDSGLARSIAQYYNDGKGGTIQIKML